MTKNQHESLTADQKARLAIWDQVKSTPPKHTKLIEYGKRKFTTIDATHQLREATKLWGPYGDKWGLCDLETSTIEVDGRTSFVLKCHLYYPTSEGTPGGFDVIVDMPFRHGDDIMKKLITTARSKALSYLGFSADVYMGLFDDAQYVADAKIRFGNKKEWCENIKQIIVTAKTQDDLAKMSQRLDELVYDETITDELGEDLSALIETQSQLLLNS